MAVAPRTRRAGRVEIENKEREQREALKKRRENEVKEEISPEEHEKRMSILRSIGVIK
jgi:hypothetical protein